MKKDIFERYMAMSATHDALQRRYECLEEAISILEETCRELCKRLQLLEKHR